MDLGGANIRYADTLNTSGLLFSPFFQIESPRAAARAMGTLGQLDVGGWTAQGTLDAALYTRVPGSLVGEISASAGGSAHRDGTRTGQYLGFLRLHTPPAHRGAWVGLGAGATTDGDVWRSVLQGELAGWMRHSKASALLTFTPTIVADSIRYFDTGVRLAWETPKLEIGVQGGLRAGERSLALGGTDRAWANGSVLFWLTPWAGLLASGGTYPVDLTQGFPGGRFLSLGVRLRTTERREALERSALEEQPSAVVSVGGVNAFEALTAANGQTVLRILSPGANGVEIASDFTNWKAVALRADGSGWWTATLPIPAGTHQLNVRVDGGPWLVPPGLPSVADEFGGKVGLLVVVR
jgi:hypothetical protein